MLSNEQFFLTLLKTSRVLWIIMTLFTRQKNEPL